MSRLQGLQQAIRQLNKEAETWNEEMIKRENMFYKIQEQAKKYNFKEGEIMRFNVGGRSFAVLKETLTQRIKNFSRERDDQDEYYEPHMLSIIASGMHTLTLDKDGSIFIDRDGKYFGYILNYLRCAGMIHNFSMPQDKHAVECIYLEARYYNVQGLMDYIEEEHADVVEHLNEEYSVSMFKGSQILTRDQGVKLWIMLSDVISQKTKPSLLFRASRDGFNASQFHNKCDNKGATVTIIKSSNDCIFGGYTPLNWNSNNAHQCNNQTFLFSLVRSNGEKTAVKIKNDGPQHGNQYSIYGVAGYGPTFGGGNDLLICSDFSSNSNSCNLGHSFSCPNGYQFNTTQAQSYFTGSRNFTVREMEVYQLT
ncbi:hypothetical protein C9374_010846 [Naegleria lovaniensis]|uniref:TLDc domain-containing protein n=1 Tax=Naegleria lovaniensis TaxID=51637 RepID=A0AA88GD30_NAELO|nr:uncharacterized protein C9374_010846 [Naegleria lovaniensis]KAG2374276.1 hypothetical protein C9374_010846 [Naegleria lovaniensis]